MHHTPAISIVIPAYNEEKTIKRCITQFSPYKQKHHLEIIVADGKSTDRTAAIAKRYADRVIIEKKKSNIATGRNAGAYAAHGSIIMELDADTRIDDVDTFLSMIHTTFSDKDVVVAMPRLRIYKEEETFKDRVFHIGINRSVQLANHFGSFLSKGECQIFRKSVFKRIGGYDRRIVVGEDCDLFYRMARKGKAVIIPYTVRHSPRRFRKEGYVKLMLGSYLPEGMSLIFKGRSRTAEWKPVR